MNRWIAILAAVLAVSAGGWFVLNSGSPGQTQTDPLGAANAQSAADVDTSGITEMAIGNLDSQVEVIEYASYTCPHCASFHAGPFKNLKADFIDTDKIRFVYREVYFDRFGLWASMVARCGGEQRFFGITDMMYQQQKEWIGSGDPQEIIGNLRRIGKVAGLSDDQLDVCLSDNDKATALVAWFQQNAEKDGIRSTPSFVIDGELYANMPYDELKSILDGKLGE